MAIRVALHHRTTYQYDRAVRLGPQIVRLRPAPHATTSVESYSLRVKPEAHFLNWQQDPHGSYQARLVFPEPTRVLVSIEVALCLALLMGGAVLIQGLRELSRRGPGYETSGVLTVSARLSPLMGAAARARSCSVRSSSTPIAAI